MAVRNPADIRNVALVGHTGCGKTTLAERLLFATGTIQRMGTVEEGNTASDFTEDEKKHKHSLRPSMLHFDHEGHMVNLIDAPGMPDFLGHAISVFPAVETVAVVVDAHKGVDTVTRRMMTIAAERRLPRMLIINKIDENNAEIEDLVKNIREEFGPECLPINLPLADRSDVISVFDEEGSGQTLFSNPDEAHQKIVEQIVEMRDELMNQYLEDGDDHNLDKQKLHDAFEAALREAHLVPICFCSAKTGAGIKTLLHVIASLLPSPLEGNPRPFMKRREEEGQEVEYHAIPDANKPLIANVFKVATDPFVGKLGVFRVHQGTIHAKSEVLVGDQKKSIRIGHLIKRQGKESLDVEELGPGDIGAVSKIDEVFYDAVLHEGHDLDSLHMRALPLPRPMYGLALDLKNHADETKFSGAMQKILSEDPCLMLDRIAATKQTVLRGLGELHLRIVIERMKDQFGIELETSTPKIAYKETITSKAEGHHRHKKQTGGAGQFGEVWLRVEPLPPDHETGFEFVNATVGGSIPKGFMPAIEKGVRQVLIDGAIAGYPFTGVRVEVYDGKHHPVDSKEIAFVTAGRKAFIDAVKKARPVLLEPIVILEVTCPADYMGDIAGDLSTKRGRVQDTRMLAGGICTVVAQAPLSELQNYSTELKSITGGSGSYTMEYSHDENTPPHIQQEVVAAFAGHKEED
ncbi:MAG: elongation factor G [Leptolyngbya sp. PLA3]|nr:MAG: elongation factor G [Cyanobacteria bacterium CYA]MCE7969624.1 elongation factor G [Leptolyngbya sp. PL-A3]